MEGWGGDIATGGSPVPAISTRGLGAGQGQQKRKDDLTGALAGGTAARLLDKHQSCPLALSIPSGALPRTGLKASLTGVAFV